MNFGIIEEFKIFYRIQQYTEMIRLQRKSQWQIKQNSQHQPHPH